MTHFHGEDGQVVIGTDPPAVSKLPTARTIQKFGRGLLLATAAFTITWTLDNVSSLDLGTQGTAVLVAVLELAYRWVRGAMGREPE